MGQPDSRVTLTAEDMRAKTFVRELATYDRSKLIDCAEEFKYCWCLQHNSGPCGKVSVLHCMCKASDGQIADDVTRALCFTQ